ncbi:MAG: hypothetical protein JSR77_10200 [Planctomycetes bacterium]|nr:hypothetical protein [Planctomycetota bacterium]
MNHDIHEHHGRVRQGAALFREYWAWLRTLTPAALVCFGGLVTAAEISREKAVKHSER